MRALTWQGNDDIRIAVVPDPAIEDPRDIIVRVTSTAICGSDLHLMDGMMPGMKQGDVLGHEFMGEVVEVGSGISRHARGDRVLVAFAIACGECFFCQRELFSLCDRSNPTPEAVSKLMGHSPAGAFGYSHLLGGFPGGQAEYVRVPHADVGAFKVPDALDDEHALFLTDILPTGYMAAENAEIEPGDTVAVWGCGPVGQFSIQSAWLLGAGRVIAIDRVPERLRMAEGYGRAETINFDDADVHERLMELTSGRGPDRCIDAVGAEAHGGGSVDAVIDRAIEAVNLSKDRPHVLREAIRACRKGGTISVPGVYIGLVNGLPYGAAMNKGLTMKTGQTHVQRYVHPLMARIEAGEIDPTAIITHRVALEDGPRMYRAFRDKEDGCVKVVMRP